MFSKIEVYQDNGGGLSMFLLDSGGNCIAYIFNLEYEPNPADGYLRHRMVEIAKDPDDVDINDGYGWKTKNADAILGEFRSTPETDLIARMDIRDMVLTAYYGRMGAAGRIAFGA